MVKYFLGIRLPQQLEKECEFWRRRFRAPRTIAHITLIPPFLWQSAEGELLRLLQEAAAHIPPFLVRGQALGSFGRRVLFVNAELGSGFKAARHKLAQALGAAGVPPEKRPYRPHITLATRLTAAQFEQFSAEAADFAPDYAFECSSISLFRFERAGQWQECAKLAL